MRELNEIQPNEHDVNMYIVNFCPVSMEKERGGGGGGC